MKLNWSIFSPALIERARVALAADVRRDPRLVFSSENLHAKARELSSTATKPRTSRPAAKSTPIGKQLPKRKPTAREITAEATRRVAKLERELAISPAAGASLADRVADVEAENARRDHQRASVAAAMRARRPPQRPAPTRAELAEQMGATTSTAPTSFRQGSKVGPAPARGRR